ncbi:hypothetical protein FDP41_001156 [Naegleria fowleri]|uniref:Transmembrane protein 43 n=1 Tax=Naegleria fowleri TaxID=5763 RepID=A0A6A5BPP9_NAEFO|nr:uncharacterized protein FDP41_001156 [Naegleria fowleri]KAF0980003.1 hypothetical protein FDP41_001156 [Naegleria fowleri]
MPLFGSNDASTRGHAGFWSSVLTTRVGRSRIISDTQLKIENTCALWFLKIIFAIFLVAAPLTLFYAENEAMLMQHAFLEVVRSTRTIVDPINSKPRPENNNQLIFFHVPSHNIRTEHPIQDRDFGLTFNGAFEVNRKTEYCQWIESHHDEEKTRSDGSKYTVRTYYYNRGWVDHLIPSLFFDQPVAHHNPQRDPFPSVTQKVEGVTLGKFHLGPNLIEKNQIPARKIEFSPEELRKITNTPANSANNFKYIGNGYFFSAYEPSTNEKALKIMLGFLEGSLFDWQVGDLFSNCQPGDIRVSFIHKKPDVNKGVSVIARQASTNGELELFKASNGYHVGVVHEGYYPSPKEMFDQEIEFYRWSMSGLLGARALIIVWGIVVSLVLLGDYVASVSDLFLSTTMLSSLMIGFVWLSLFFSHGEGFTSALLCLGASALIGYVLQTSTSQKQFGQNDGVYSSQSKKN